MANARSAWGIDIGNRALKAVKLVRTDAGLRIDDFEVIEHEHILSTAGDNKEALIQSALANFVQRHPARGNICAVSVSGVSSLARFIKLPPVETKRIVQIVGFEAKQQIPFELDEVEWSYQLFQNPDSPDVEVGIFAMRRELINEQIKHFTNVDLNVQCVQMNPLAVYNAMYHDGRLKGTTMVIDLGAENTDLIIADGETIWLRSITGMGGNTFTEVLVKSFKLPFGKAEELKRNANTSKYARQIFQAMRPVFADLVAEIQRSIGFYSSVHRDSRIKKIIAIGSTFRLAGLQKYLQQNLQIEVEKLNELAGGVPDDAKLAATFNQNILSLVSAYGLAIQAMGDAKVTSSLLPQHIRREKMWKDKTKWFGAAAAAFLLGSCVAAGGYYMRDMQYSGAENYRMNTINPILAKATGFDQQWNSQVQSAGADDRQKIANVRSMLDYRSIWPSIVGDLYAALPKNLTNAPLAQVMAVQRKDRQQIWIDAIKCTYTDDLNKNYAALGVASGFPAVTPTAAAPGGAAGAGAQIDPNVPPGSRGFYVLITITTPHDQGFLYVLNDSYVPALKKLDQNYMAKQDAANPQNPRKFYIGAVFTPQLQHTLSGDPSRPNLLQNSYDAMRNLQPDTNGAGSTPAAGQPGPVAGVAGITPDAWKDRLTKDFRQDDWTMSVPVIVVIDPPTPGAAGH